MTFVVFHAKSTVEKSTHTRRYAAEGVTARLNAKLGAGTYRFASEQDWLTHYVHNVERKNLMNGRAFIELSNTPFCCSPSTETYWSM